MNRRKALSTLIAAGIAPLAALKDRQRVIGLGFISRAQADRLREAWNASMGGASFGRVAVLDGGMPNNHDMAALNAEYYRECIDPLAKSCDDLIKKL